MIRKAVAAFVAFMLGVTFAAVSASFHHRPEIESVRVTVTANNVTGGIVGEGTQIDMVCKAKHCKWDDSTLHRGKDGSGVPYWNGVMEKAYNRAFLLYENTTADFGDLFKSELDEAFNGCVTVGGGELICVDPPLDQKKYIGSFDQPIVTYK
jgi:hypothetical protein